MSVTFCADLQLICDEPSGHDEWRLYKDYAVTVGGGTGNFIENNKRACKQQARKAGWLLLHGNKCRCPDHARILHRRGPTK